MNTPAWILCDLGKVIVDFRHELIGERLLDWMQCNGAPRVPTAGVLHEFFFSTAPDHPESRNAAMDLGHGDLAWLRAELLAAFGAAPAPAELAAIWADIFAEPRPDVLAALARFRARGHRVAICSNTNAPHWEFLADRFPSLATMADRLYLSYRMGLRKPSPAYYLSILADSQLPADRHVFVDDLAANVDAAAALGMRTVHFGGGDFGRLVEAALA
jgi:HAD superfamily hydrolase (TIGR01509 family)